MVVEIVAFYDLWQGGRNAGKAPLGVACVYDRFFSWVLFYFFHVCDGLLTI